MQNRHGTSEESMENQPRTVTSRFLALMTSVANAAAKARGVRAVERARKCLAEATVAKVELNAFTELRDEKSVMADVEAAQARWERGEARSPVDGLLFAVKDNICQAQTRSSAASRMLSNFVAPYDATCVSRLQAAGAIPMGRTNQDEFGMGSFGLNSYYGPSYRPGDHRVAGGSSSGSAIAVATEACHFALGSDTGGSVRLPAAFCGVMGFKPSYGRISRHGLISYASSLDTIGLLSGDVGIIAEAFGVCAGPDSNDSTCITSPLESCPLPNETQSDAAAIPLRVGIPVEYNVAELSEDARAAWHAQVEHVKICLGPETSIVPMSVPSVRDALPAYYVLACAEASSNLARYDGVQYGHRAAWSDDFETLHQEYTASRTEGFGAEVQRRILMGAHVLSAEAFDTLYLRANAVRDALREDFSAVFHHVDFLITPVAPGPAPTPEEAAQQDLVQSYLTDVMTVPSSLAGLPSMALPFARTSTSQEDVGSYQLIAGPRQDAKLLSTARLLSAA
ncbi:Glutamyl-tRNAGln amidotransferase subunit A, mitochondrial [Hondaea fermentalgiana]|uniref:Glutamyl-tRNA(Gln) amidotransferase subunit A, mitochondrial n=1 Tax=Hondaea fermentalgiana TaxID=2315210 RepID=A0A2R5G6W8_9STRA|nr:Glutamyl-tRNAGln amidotransferase subunit A, mitochondrial [Hondaea fermentalgiana]|eukprot:GBG26059.1 Glutamyl-tRNAGln amidotransferase subunit A, mitochondrial [Hondaea fermentalgiana]